MLIAITLAALSATASPRSAAPSTAAPAAPVVATTCANSGAAAPAEALCPPEAEAPPERVSVEKGEVIHLETRDKLLLEGSYYEPKGAKGLAPGAILIHDAGADRRQMQELALSLQKKGFGVLTFDLRGHGDSTSENLDWSKAEDDKALASLWSFAANDVKAAASWLRERTEIHASNLSVVGVGAGCSLAIRHALDDENTRAVVLISPRAENYGFNLPQGIGDLEGLPTLILSGKDARTDLTRLKEAAHSQFGDAFVEISVMRCDQTEVLSDKRLGSEVGKWLKDTVVTRR